MNPDGRDRYTAALVKEFRKFFSNGVAGSVGDYKAYIIKNNTQDEERIRALLELLDKNGIEYGTGTGIAKGFNYHTAKEETFSIAMGDILISAAQPKATMVKVLFEPQSKLVDSVTYNLLPGHYHMGMGSLLSGNSLSVRDKILLDSLFNIG